MTLGDRHHDLSLKLLDASTIADTTWRLPRGERRALLEEIGRLQAARSTNMDEMARRGRNALVDDALDVGSDPWGLCSAVAS